MIFRAVKLVGVSLFYIGRLDTPVFARGVGNLSFYTLDGLPNQFRKDMLLHDAHRHPYIESLGKTYLLKLRYGDKFGTRAGGAWRLIFCLALMPWLRRYRLDDGDDEALRLMDWENSNSITVMKRSRKLLMTPTVDSADSSETTKDEQQKDKSANGDEDELNKVMENLSKAHGEEKTKQMVKTIFEARGWKYS